ncbi:MAG: hypothetical protein K6T16_02185 [Candidatus Pacearchaeota archaeon]|nr:hypothetical protein [Candidatus Pacearchaeota archaeon]
MEKSARTVLKGECADLGDVLAIISNNGNYTSRYCLSLYHENRDRPIPRYIWIINIL